jgi:hypothetical protein
MLFCDSNRQSSLDHRRPRTGGPEAEVRVLDLERPHMRDRVNTGVGRSAHIQRYQKKQHKKRKEEKKGTYKVHQCSYSSNIVPISLRSQPPCSKRGLPTNNPVCARIIRSLPKRELEARFDVDVNAMAGRSSESHYFEFDGNFWSELDLG